MNHFKTEVCAVKDVCPGVDDVAVRRLDGLVEVEAIQVEGHRAYTKCGEPDAYDWPSTEEEM